MGVDLTTRQIESFHEDGFVVLDRVLDAETVEAARQRVPKLFSGDFETGLMPDEWNWREAAIRPN